MKGFDESRWKGCDVSLDNHEALGRRKIEGRALPWGIFSSWGSLCASVFCELCRSAEARALSFSVLRASCLTTKRTKTCFFLVLSALLALLAPILRNFVLENFTKAFEDQRPCWVITLVLPDAGRSTARLNCHLAKNIETVCTFA